MNWDRIITFVVDNIVPVVVISFRNNAPCATDEQLLTHATLACSAVVKGIAEVHGVEAPRVEAYVAEAIAGVRQ